MSVSYALLDLLDAANAARRAGATEAEIAHAAGIELPANRTAVTEPEHTIASEA